MISLRYRAQDGAGQTPCLTPNCPAPAAPGMGRCRRCAEVLLWEELAAFDEARRGGRFSLREFVTEQWARRFGGGH